MTVTFVRFAVNIAVYVQMTVWLVGGYTLLFGRWVKFRMNLPTWTTEARPQNVGAYLPSYATPDPRTTNINIYITRAFSAPPCYIHNVQYQVAAQCCYFLLIHSLNTGSLKLDSRTYFTWRKANTDVWTQKNYINLSKSSPVTGLEWPRGFQEVKVPRFHDNGTGWW